MPRKSLIALLCALCALVAVPASASAATNVSVAVADQSPNMFASPAYKALKMRKTRYFVRWDAIDQPAAISAAETYAREARRNRVKVLMHISTDDLRERKAKLPTVRQYRSKVGKLVKRMRALGVREFGVWNEANHDTQPTFRSPKRAAQFFLEMRKMCRTCTIVGLDILDQKGAASYMRRFYTALGKRRSLVKLVGIHNYSEVNRRLKKPTARYPLTRTIIKTAKRYNKRTKFYFTETGGLAEFGKAFPCDLKRQANRTSYMFSLAKKFRRDVSRLYIYNWTGTDCSTRFDAGLVDGAGNPRPAYDVVKRNLRNFKR